MSVENMTNWTCDYFMKNEESCKNSLEMMKESKEIPSLNSCALHDLKDGQLVRFRGMIQDMYNPEFYFETYEVKDANTGESVLRNGMYRDTAFCQENENILLESQNNKSSERQTFVVISVPGLNDWAREKPEGFKKPLNPSPRSSNKRSLDECDEEPMDTSEPARKKEKDGDNSSKNDVERATLNENLLNFPVPTEGGRACIVKVYKEDSSFKLNQVVDIIGFISLDPTVHTASDSEEFIDDAEIRAHHPPTSLIPRLHAIKISNSSEEYPEKLCGEIGSRVEAVRSDLHKMFSQILFGDDLAADYVIAHLLSTVYMRREDISLGHFSLNITHFSTEKFPNFAKNFYDMLMQILPKSHYFECTLENLNNDCLIPKKDYECNRLMSGTLQLSNNTHLIIDETKLEPGKLSEAGRKNYGAINELSTFQKVTYDFTYYTMEYETDIPVFVLSGTKSFIPCMIQVPLNIDKDVEKIYEQVLEAAGHFLKDENRLNDMRQYFKQLKSLDFEIGEEISHTIQEDFVNLRQMDKSINPDNLHSLMVFARLMALSHGETSLSLIRWRETLRKEIERLGRLPKSSK